MGFALPINLELGHSTSGDHHHDANEHGLDAAGMDYVNDRRLTKVTMALLAVMAVICSAILTASVLSMGG